MAPPPEPGWRPEGARHWAGRGHTPVTAQCSFSLCAVQRSLRSTSRGIRGSPGTHRVVSCSQSHSWGVLALPITRGARTLPSDSKCYEERAWSLPKSSRQTEAVGKPLGQVQVFILQQKKLRGQGLAQGHRVDLQARQGWIQALDSWLGVFPTISALKQFRLGGRDTRPFQNPV